MKIPVELDMNWAWAVIASDHPSIKVVSHMNPKSDVTALSSNTGIAMSLSRLIVSLLSKYTIAEITTRIIQLPCVRQAALTRAFTGVKCKVRGPISEKDITTKSNMPIPITMLFLAGESSELVGRKRVKLLCDQESMRGDRLLQNYYVMLCNHVQNWAFSSNHWEILISTSCLYSLRTSHRQTQKVVVLPCLAYDSSLHLNFGLHPLRDWSPQF